MTKIFGNQIYFAKPISAYLCLTIVFISYNNRGTLYKVQPNILEKTIKKVSLQSNLIFQLRIKG